MQRSDNNGYNRPAASVPAAIQQNQHMANSKGVQEPRFENPANYFNCFLNVVIQAMWHLPSFQLLIKEITSRDNRNRVASDPLVDSIRIIFEQMKSNERESKDEVLTVNSLRRELFKRSYSQSAFELNKKADSAEVLQKLLEIIHTVLQDKQQSSGSVQKHSKDTGCSCLVHENFKFNLWQTQRCKCGATKSFNFNEDYFVQFQNIKELLDFFSAEEDHLQEVANQQGRGKIDSDKIYTLINGQFFKSYAIINTKERLKCCPKDDNCEQKTTQLSYKLRGQNHPTVLMFNIGWQEEDIKNTTVLKVITSLPRKMCLENGYSVECPNAYEEYELKGVISFVGAHYMIYLLQDNPGSSQWVQFNDTEVQYFADWSEMSSHMIESQAAPTMIFYDKNTHRKPLLKQEIDKIKPMLSSEEIQMQYIRARELEQSLTGMFGDENFLQEQMKLMEQFKKQQEGGNNNEQESPDKKDKDDNSVPANQIDQQMQNLAVSQQEESKVDSRGRGDSGISGNGESGIYKQLKELRKLSKDNIYIFECCKCQCFVLLHQAKCGTCQYKNPFVDTTIQVDEVLERNVLQELKEIQMNMGLEVNIPDWQAQEAAEAARHLQDQNQNSGNNRQQKQFVPINLQQGWRCPECELIHPLQINKCCHKYLDNYDDLTSILVEFDPNDPEVINQKPKRRRQQNQMDANPVSPPSQIHQQQQRNSKNVRPINRQEPAETGVEDIDGGSGNNNDNDNQSGPKEDEWDCEFCQKRNRYSLKNILSSFCKSCKRQNEMIKEMIQMCKDQHFNKDVEENIKFYNDLKAKGQKVCPHCEEYVIFQEEQACEKCRLRQQRRQQQKGSKRTCPVCNINVLKDNENMCSGCDRTRSYNQQVNKKQYMCKGCRQQNISDVNQTLCANCQGMSRCNACQRISYSSKKLLCVSKDCPSNNRGSSRMSENNCKSCNRQIMNQADLANGMCTMCKAKDKASSTRKTIKCQYCQSTNDLGNYSCMYCKRTLKR